MYDFGAVSGYAGGYGDDGYAGGLHAPTGEDAMSAVKGLAITGGTAGLIAVLEGYQNKGVGGEMKLGKSVPVTLLGTLLFSAAGLAGVGETIGVGDETFHDIAKGMFSVWTTNRGHAFGQDRGKEMAKTDKTASGGAVPRRAFGVPAYQGAQQQQQNVYPQYAR
jgi:hypothetical protein